MKNAINYVKILESTGISREQAEAHVQVLAEFLEGDLVTKQDLLNSEKATKSTIERFETSVDASLFQLDTKINTSFIQLDTKINNVVEHLENKILQSEYRMTIKLGSLITVGLAAMTAVIKLL